MAQIYSPPPECLDPPSWDINLTHGENCIAEEEWIENLRAWVIAEFGKKNDYIGEIVQEGVGDGYAQYMVASLRPLKLIHLPVGDAWNFRWAHKWNATDVKQMVDGQIAMRKLFGGV